MTRTSLLCAAALAAALSACTVNNEAPEVNDANAVADGGAMAGDDLTTPPADVSDPSNDSAGNSGDGGDSDTPPATNASIPAQYQGRWGMVPNDCDPSRADNKGLITIDSKTIKFYESRATLKEQRPAIATSFSGLYAFTGEGQEWQKVVTLTRTGDKLKRADDEGSYDYTRCR